jgi:hypothetical protein
MKIAGDILEQLYPEVERVIDLVIEAFEGQEIPNGAIILGLGAVIGLTLNKAIPGTEKFERPGIETVLPWLEAGMAFGRDMELRRVQ